MFVYKRGMSLQLYQCSIANHQ